MCYASTLTNLYKASDIMGANNYKSPFGSQWSSILLKTGVYTGGTPAVEPTIIQEDVFDAVQWAVKDSGWEDTLPKIEEPSA